MAERILSMSELEQVLVPGEQMPECDFKRLGRLTVSPRRVVIAAASTPLTHETTPISPAHELVGATSR